MLKRAPFITYELYRLYRLSGSSEPAADSLKWSIFKRCECERELCSSSGWLLGRRQITILDCRDLRCNHKPRKENLHTCTYAYFLSASAYSSERGTPVGRDSRQNVASQTQFWRTVLLSSFLLDCILDKIICFTTIDYDLVMLFDEADVIICAVKENSRAHGSTLVLL
jgi:hypothetical protein